MKNTSVPLISIITIVLNGKSELEKTIESIRNQKDKTIEFIVIDGGSVDGTLEVINKHQDIIDYSISEPDSGISDAFNKGIRKAKGEWINFLNAGDIYKTENVLSLISPILRNANVGIVTGFAQYKSTTIPKRRIYNWYPLWKRAYISHQASFVRSNIFTRYGMYDEAYQIRMDYEFWLRVFKSERLLFIPHLIIDYLPGGVSGRDVLNFNVEEISANKKNQIRYRKFANLLPLARILLRY